MPANNTTNAFDFTIDGTVDKQTYQLGDDPRRISLYLAVKSGGPVKVAFGAEASPSNGIDLVLGAPLPMWQNPDSTPKKMVSFFSTVAVTVTVITTSEVPGG